MIYYKLLHYLLLCVPITESLDEDTETRRLSPVHLSADGYVSLLNGPMDHGWCLGYTCQERVSTFFGIIATERNYSLYFSSTEPQKIRFHLLDVGKDEVVRISLFYKQPQRQDVYRNGEIVEVVCCVELHTMIHKTNIVRRALVRL